MNKETSEIDGKFYRTAKVAMLPTEKAVWPNCIWKGRISGQLRHDQSYKTYKVENPVDDSMLPQHLYILSNEEIKEGDWYYNYRLDTIFQSIRKEGYNTTDKEQKIIATTDSSLTYEFRRGEVQFPEKLPLPRPSNAFIEAFVREQGKIDEVLVEVQEHNWYPIDDEFAKIEYKLKVAPDNTITIKPVVGKTYTRDELRKELTKIAHHVQYKGYGGHSVTTSFVNHWMEENNL